MTHEIHHPVRVAIVGVGNVGASFAFSLLMSGLATEIVLIDANNSRAEGEAMDLNHAVPLSQSTRIWAGSLQDTAGALVTVITAGSAQKPGETRLNLASRNVNILRSIIPDVVKFNPHGIILIASNPVDILTYAALKISGLPSNQVFGSGTILDTARFRYLLSQHFGVDPRSVHGYIIGEHGDSEVPVWSLANIAGMRLPVFCQQNNLACQDQILDEIFSQTRDAAYQIIQRKGATYYAIAVGLTRISEAIIRDQNTVLSASSLIKDYYGISDVCFSLPSVIDRGGVERILRLELSDKELASLKESALVLKQINQSLGL
jgi:L-lactate dehydrogenase